ncbi:hypothetical protein VTN00DRAFT_2866 [Thermoascus crustaceus]|uniref:uncharacterized protein n=1 Tax=Thermoascus crustaceus TaxID=5088 RepID=UPI003743F052
MARHFDAAVESRGQKRPADSDPEGEQPLTKKFGRLHIGAPANFNNGLQKAAKAPASQEISWPSESMLLDDTKHTTYIHDLDRELAEIEAQEQCIEFLPEIEKKLTSIPKAILTDQKPKNNEIVLYRVPTSLTVPKERDSVRKAIIESRARARQKQAEDQKTRTSKADINIMTDLSHSSSGASTTAEHDDSMDIDVEL